MDEPADTASEPRVSICFLVDLPKSYATDALLGAWVGVQEQLLSTGMTKETLLERVKLLEAYILPAKSH